MDINKFTQSNLLLRIDDLEDELKEKTKFIDSLNREVILQKDIIRELKLHSVKEEDHLNLKTRYDLMCSKYDILRGEKDILYKDNRSYQINNEKLEEQINKFQDQKENVENLTKQIQSLNKEINFFSNTNEDLLVQIKAKEDEIEKCKLETDQWKSEYEKISEMIRSKQNNSFDISQLSGVFDPNSSVQEFSFSNGINVNKMPSFCYETVADMKLPLLEQEKETLQNQVITLEKDLNEVRDEYKTLQIQLDERNSEMNKLTNSLKIKEEHIITIEKKLEKIENENKSINILLDKRESEISDFVDLLKIKEEQNANLKIDFKKTIDECMLQIEESRVQQEKLKSFLEQKTHDFDQLTHKSNSELSALKQDFERQTNEYKALQIQLDERNLEICNLTNSLRIKEAHIITIEANLEKIESENKSINILLNKRESEISDFIDLLKIKEEQNATLQIDFKNTIDKCKTLQNQLDERNSEILNLIDSLQNYKEQAAVFKTDFEKIKNDYNALQIQFDKRDSELSQQLTNQVETIKEIELQFQDTKQQFLNKESKLNLQLSEKDKVMENYMLQIEELRVQQGKLKSFLEQKTHDFDQLTHKSNSELSILKQDFERQTSEFLQKESEMLKAYKEKEESCCELQVTLELLKNKLTDQQNIEKSKDVIITELSSSLKESETKVDEMQRLIDHNSTELDAMKKQHLIAEQRIEQLEIEVKSSNERANNYKKLSEKLTNDQQELKKQVENFKENSVSSSNKNIEKLQEQIQKLNADSETMQKNFKAKILHFKKQLDIEQQSFAMERKTKERLLNENMKLELQVKKLTQELKELSESQSSPVLHKCRSGSSLMPEQLVVNVNTNLHQAPTIPVVPHRLSNRFEMADEEGQFMDPSCIDSSQLFGNCPLSASSSFASAQSNEDRIQQLIHRNSMLQPHLRSTYPVELQEVLDNFDENSIRSGSVSSLGSIATATTSVSTSHSSNSNMMNHEFARPSSTIMPRNSSQTQLNRKVAQSIENIHSTSSNSSTSSNASSTSSKQSAGSRRPAPVSFSISHENLPKKLKKESNNILRATLTPSKLFKRVINGKRNGTPNKNRNK